MSDNVKKSGPSSPATSGLRSSKRKRPNEPSSPSRKRTTLEGAKTRAATARQNAARPSPNKKPSANTRAAAARQKATSSPSQKKPDPERASTRAATARQKAATDHMETIYRDLFDRVRCSDLDIRQPGIQADLGGQPAEVEDFYQELTGSALRMASDMDTWQVISALRATYWIAVHASGYEFLEPTGPTEVSGIEAERQGHKRASILMSAISAPGEPPMRYSSMHAIAAVWGRYHQVATAHGWKTLAVLLHSWSFRSIARKADPDPWETLVACIGENAMSLKLLGSFYCSGWADAMKRALPEGVELLTEDERMDYSGDYHHWRVPSAKAERVCERVVPPFCVLDASNWRDQFPGGDPRKVAPGGREFFDVRGPCVSCAQVSAECGCNLENWSPARVELINAGPTGTGVRALQKFKKGQLLGEYVGDLVKNFLEGSSNASGDLVSDSEANSSNATGGLVNSSEVDSGNASGDLVSSSEVGSGNASGDLVSNSEADSSSSWEDLYMLFGYPGGKTSAYSTTAKENGNWTRFVNHSCQANSYIDHVERRGKVLSIYRAVKDIEMFEEVTTSYGSDYFKERGLKCLCPAKRHLDKCMS